MYLCSFYSALLVCGRLLIKMMFILQNFILSVDDVSDLQSVSLHCWVWGRRQSCVKVCCAKW